MTLSIMDLIVILSIAILGKNFECHYAECSFFIFCCAECRYAECRYAECLGAHDLAWSLGLVGKPSIRIYWCILVIVIKRYVLMPVL
jgi:hypothetical protein